jgi:hypothetical protein
MFAFRIPLLLVMSLIRTTLATPAPTATTTTIVTTAATPEFLTPIGPIRFDVTILSFNYYEDFNCATLLGNMNISSIDLDRNTCFELPGNSLIFTYQLHDGTLSYYNPNEVNSKSSNELR